MYELRRLKEYIGVDPDASEDAMDMEKVNCRRCTINPDGHPLSEKVYRKLINQVKPDVAE